MATLRLRELTLPSIVDPVTSGDIAVDLLVEPGHLVAAIAPPALASALARTVVGLAAPVRGWVYVGGRDVTGLAPAARQIGYLPPGGALLPHLTIRRNIEYGLRRRVAVRAVTRSWVQSLVDRLELAPSLHLRPHHLTEAQRLRAALARAMAGLPEALVIDLPGGSGGGDRLADLISRAVPQTGPGVAVLLCSAAAEVLDGVVERVRVGERG